MSDYPKILDEAFGSDRWHDWPEWLRLASPRQQELLARAIDKPAELTDDEWTELDVGPTICGIYNVKTTWATGAMVLLAFSGFGFVLFELNAVAVVLMGLSMAPAGWFLYLRARYQMRLRRARREARPTVPT